MENSIRTETKKCSKCSFPKSLNEFHKAKSKDGHKGQCKKCVLERQEKYRNENYEKVSARVRESRKVNADHYHHYSKRWKLMNRYGLTIEDQDRMWQAQQGLCACCHNLMTRPVVEHDHKTNKVRGLTCNGCNRGLGFFDDNPAKLRAAAEYLEKHLVSKAA